MYCNESEDASSLVFITWNNKRNTFDFLYGVRGYFLFSVTKDFKTLIYEEMKLSLVEKEGSYNYYMQDVFHKREIELLSLEPQEISKIRKLQGSSEVILEKTTSRSSAKSVLLTGSLLFLSGFFLNKIIVHAPSRRAVPPPYRTAARELFIFLHAAERFFLGQVNVFKYN